MAISEAVLLYCAKKVRDAMVSGLGRRAKKALAQPEREAALGACTEAGVLALVTEARDLDEYHENLLADILQKFFGHEDLGGELQAWMQGRSLDRAALMEMFEEAGFVADTLPGLDLEAALAKFEVAFLSTAEQQSALQGEIQARRALLSNELGERRNELLAEILHDLDGLESSLGEQLRQVIELLRADRVPIQPLQESYLHRLERNIRNLPLSGVDPGAARAEGAKDVRLAAVYTALLTRTVEDLDPDTLKMRPRGEHSKVLTALECLDREEHLVLLGDPGSGKTTFVRFVALCMAGEALGSAEANLEVLTAPLPPKSREQEAEEKEGEEKEGEEKEPVPQPWSHGGMLPIYVELRHLAARGLPAPGEPADGDTLWRFLEAELGDALADYGPVLKAEMLERGCLVLLDGLDEVPEAATRRDQVKAAVQGFAATFPKCRLVVTSRTYAYQRQEWKLDDFEEAVLAPFEPWQIRHFIDHWYGQVGPRKGLTEDEATGEATLLKNAIGASRSLGELAPRPLLLTLMASLHSWRGGTLPEKREELYADAVDLLLDQWEQPKIVKDARGKPVAQQPSLAQWLRVDRDVVRRELNRLALEGHRDQPHLEGTADLAEERLIQALWAVARNPEVNPVRLVEYLRDRAGLLAARGEGVYAFPHRTFQEYLAACHLTEQDFPHEVAALGRTDPQRWREVVLLAGAKVARGTPAALWLLVEALSPETANGPPAEEAWGARLAGEALAESGDGGAMQSVDPAKLRRVRQRQVAVLEGDQLPALERAGAGRVLARLGDPREGVTTVMGLEMCRVPAGEFWWGGGYDNHEGQETPWERWQVEDPYWISRFPVTQAQFGEFAKGGGYREERFWPEAREAGVWEAGEVTDWFGSVSEDGPASYGSPFSHGNHPVVGVTWYEALAYTRWLTERLHEQGWPEGWAMRLPSEPEWEKAARGGLELPADGPRVERLKTLRGALGGHHEDAELIDNPHPRREYPWAEELTPEHANYGQTELGATSAVGAFPRGRSPYGCEEMSGNVWEWCRDFRQGEATDPHAVVVLRGGSWADPARSLAAAVRSRIRAGNRLQFIGFRVVLVRVSEHA